MTMCKSATTKSYVIFWGTSTHMLQCICFLAPTQAPVSLVAHTVPPSHGRKFVFSVIFIFLNIKLLFGFGDFQWTEGLIEKNTCSY